MSNKDYKKQFEEQMESVRQQVVMDELKARHWKAQYDTAYWHLEFEKIIPAYTELLDKKAKELKEAQDLRNKVRAEEGVPGLIIAEA